MYTPFFRELYIPDIDLSIKKSKYTPREDIKPVESDIKEIRGYEDEILNKDIPEVPKDLFSLSYERAGGDKNKYSFFRKLAEKESGFNHRIQNLQGAPAYGYFQFMQDGKRWNNISKFANTDIETFRNNPEVQIKAAHKLADNFMNSFSDRDIARARELGYSDSALVAGAWLAGTGGVKKFLHSGISLNDKHWSKDGKTGTDVATRMKEFNGYFKSGGTLKLQGGSSKEWVKDWYKNREDLVISNATSQTSVPLVRSSVLKRLLHNIDSTTVGINPSILPENVKGSYSPLFKRITFRDVNDESIGVHEYTHSADGYNQEKMIQALKDKYSDTLHLNNVVEDEYLDSPWEIYARLMQLRHHLNADPKHKFTNDEIDDLKRSNVDKITLIQRVETPDGIETVVSEHGKDGLISTDPKVPGTVREQQMFIQYDDQNTFNILDRYNTNFIREILNDVASTKKADVIHAQDGLKVPKSWRVPMLNGENYDYSNGTYDSKERHWTSRNPRTGLVTKSLDHPTISMSWDSDKKEGYRWHHGLNGKIYSRAPYEIGIIDGNLVQEHEIDNPNLINGFQNVEQVYNHIMSLGATPEEAAGLTGAFIKESGLNHNVVSSRGARGIAQLLGQKDKDYRKWLKEAKLSDNWKNQVQWVYDQLYSGSDHWANYWNGLTEKKDKGLSFTEKERRDYELMKNSKYHEYSYDNYRNTAPYSNNPGDIAEVFTWTFERPGEEEADINRRKSYAWQVYRKMNGHDGK